MLIHASIYFFSIEINRFSKHYNVNGYNYSYSIFDISIEDHNSWKKKF